jgi:hypothetical protein
MASSRKEAAASLEQLEWRGQALPVRTEPVRLALLFAEQQVALQGDEHVALNKREEQYLAIFSAYDDAAKKVQ